jgi:hypothetical protein
MTAHRPPARIGLAVLVFVRIAGCGGASERAHESSAGDSPASPPPASRFDNGRERPGVLEPLPENGVLGEDDDDDHIRDDIAAYIDATHGADEAARLGARQLARALQHALAHGGDRAGAVEAGHESGRAITCLHELLGSERAGVIVGELEARTVDTEERFAAYRRMQRNVSGAYFPGGHGAGICRFDTKGLRSP